MFKNIVLSYLCDDCGKPFSITRDSAAESLTATRGRPVSLMDFVDELCAGGNVGYNGPTDHTGGVTNDIASFQDGKHLCGVCTGIHDRRKVK